MRGLWRSFERPVKRCIDIRVSRAPERQEKKITHLAAGYQMPSFPPSRNPNASMRFIRSPFQSLSHTTISLPRLPAPPKPPSQLLHPTCPPHIPLLPPAPPTTTSSHFNLPSPISHPPRASPRPRFPYAPRVNFSSDAARRDSPPSSPCGNARSCTPGRCACSA